MWFKNKEKIEFANTNDRNCYNSLKKYEGLPICEKYVDTLEKVIFRGTTTEALSLINDNIIVSLSNLKYCGYYEPYRDGLFSFDWLVEKKYIKYCDYCKSMLEVKKITSDKTLCSTCMANKNRIEEEEKFKKYLESKCTTDGSQEK